MMSLPLTLDFSDESKQPQLWAAQVTTRLLAFTAVVLRVVARRAGRLPFWWDDYLIIGITVVLLIPEFGGEIATIVLGAGRHLGWLIANGQGEPIVSVFFKLAYWTELTYAPCTTPIKCSILCLYIRIFGIRTWFKRLCYALIAVSTVWCLVTFFLFVFQCTPTSDAWSAVVRGDCMEFSTLSLATNIPNLVIHFLILLMPLYPIWSLQMSSTKKLLISAILAIGTAEVAISVVRVVILGTLTFEDPTWDVGTAILWSTLEINVGIICCCLPVLGPLLPKRIRDVTKHSESSEQKETYPTQQTMRPYIRHEDLSGEIHSPDPNDPRTTPNAILRTTDIRFWESHSSDLEGMQPKTTRDFY